MVPNNNRYVPKGFFELSRRIGNLRHADQVTDSLIAFVEKGRYDCCNTAKEFNLTSSQS